MTIIAINVSSLMFTVRNEPTKTPEGRNKFEMIFLLKLTDDGFLKIFRRTCLAKLKRTFIYHFGKMESCNICLQKLKGNIIFHGHLHSMTSN